MSRYRGRGRTARCTDCGGKAHAIGSDPKILCKRCKKRHRPKAKTYAIIKFYERKYREERQKNDQIQSNTS